VLADCEGVDCFINSILQALAGLPDLRKYLIREIHRRKLDGPDVYKATAEEVEGKGKSAEVKLIKLKGLRSGMVTEALKEILDRLNERPIYRKTISAEAFVSALQAAFQTRISRNQQDAQEFLQIVAERLCEEYHAGHKARRKAKELSVRGLGLIQDEENTSAAEEESPDSTAPSIPIPALQVNKDPSDEDGQEEKPSEEGFPFEGKLESQIECEMCHFKPKPAISSFVTLTLSVPQRNHTTLNHCFDGLLKVETIHDFKCDKCRLIHAIEVKSRKLSLAKDEKSQSELESDISKLQKALDEDPEKPPKDVELPDLKLAPTSRIQRSTRLSSFPKILAIHLSRSIYSASQLSTKNLAKVTFPETLPLGSIVDQRKYRLLGVVTHKGGHNSGHYETFRRQISSVPFSTPHNFGANGAYSQRGSPNPSAVQSPRLTAQEEGRSDGGARLSTVLPDALPVSPSTASLSSRSSLSITSTSTSRLRRKPAPTSAPRSEVTSPTGSYVPATNSVRLSTASVTSRLKGKDKDDDAKGKDDDAEVAARQRRKLKKKDNKWWRISDDRVRESRTSDVLGMQKEVYLLFYELVRPEGGM
jgi:ubiquitin carboxyl-terminal hydrolase 16